MSEGIKKIFDKVLITGKLKLLTGMHIGYSKEFSQIGAVDSVVVRDPVTKIPVIPGSSLKGKMRTLLARSTSKGYNVQKHSEDNEKIKELFGSSSPIIHGKLQFFDLKMTAESVYEISNSGNTELYLTEIKFENSIDRLTCVANPRQLERVPAGAEFEFNLVYNVETDDHQIIKEDFETISTAISLLHYDYIGGSGSRGYGKVAIHDIEVIQTKIVPECPEINTEELKGVLENAEK
jgi:CRISPR-associated protein Csm3